LPHHILDLGNGTTFRTHPNTLSDTHNLMPAVHTSRELSLLRRLAIYPKFFLASQLDEELGTLERGGTFITLKEFDLIIIAEVFELIYTTGTRTTPPTLSCSIVYELHPAFARSIVGSPERNFIKTP
jgi:hypothetical protein